MLPSELNSHNSYTCMYTREAIPLANTWPSLRICQLGGGGENNFGGPTPNIWRGYAEACTHDKLDPFLMCVGKWQEHYQVSKGWRLWQRVNSHPQ